MATKNDPICNPNLYMRGGPPDINKNRTQNENSFDLLLREAKAKLHKRKAWHRYIFIGPITVIVDILQIEEILSNLL